MTIHYLKVWPEFYPALVDGTKRFEWRRNDRNFAVGDLLCLREFTPEVQDYTGRYVVHQVTYLLKSNDDLGVPEGYCVMSLKRWRKPMPVYDELEAPR